MKDGLVVYSATSKFVDRDLSSALCDQLEAEFETTWMFSRAVPKMFKGRRVHRVPELSRFRFRVWLYLFELQKYAYRQSLFGKDLPLPHLGLSSLSRKFLVFVLRARLSRVFRWASLTVMRFTVPRFPTMPGRVAACVCFSAPNDPIFDDIVRYFRSRETPVINVPLNWDNASSKPYLELPDLVLNWGEQTAELSRQLHGVTSVALGSPRFDALMPSAPSSAEAMAFLGLDPNLEYILFAGASFPFDEMGALNVLSDLLEREVRCRHRIIYRPHPEPWPRSSTSELSEASRRFVCGDPTRRLFHQDDLRQYQFLFSAVSGLITPYSTMLVDAARHGVPALAIGYNSRLHPEFDWTANSKHQPHLRFTEGARWIVECYDQRELAGAFADFLCLLSDEAVRGDAVADFTRLVRMTNKSYGDELTAAIRLAVGGARRREG